MSVTLSQTNDAAFPDRGTTGMRAALNTGSAGAYLSHDLGATQNVLHVRLVVNTHTANGGSVQIAGAQTEADAPAWTLELSPDTGTVTAHIGATATMTGVLPTGLSWQCIETELDTTSGAAALWLNGRQVASISGSFGTLTMRHVWLGGVNKTPAMTGAYFLDEWRIADGYIGPVTVAASSPYADDPARWLVIYNTNDTDADSWADTYRKRRGIPFANLLGLPLSSNEVVTTSEYADLTSSVNDYLTSHALSDQVVGIVAGYRVPGYVDVHGNDTVWAPISALLGSPDTSTDVLENPNFKETLAARPEAGQMNDTRMTARLDAPDLGEATAMLDRADAMLSNGLGNGDDATIWFDPIGGLGLAPETDQWRAWANSLDRMRTRLPIERSDDGQGYTDDNFDSINHDGFLWAFPASEPSAASFFQTPAGRRALSLQLHKNNPTATTVRQSGATNWIQTPHAAGYAAAVAASAGYSSTFLPEPRPLFVALRRGWTLGEAWYLARPWLRDKLYLVGDPLMTVAMPRAGWDVYGSMHALEAMDPTTPTYALRINQKSLTLDDAARPAPGTIGHYVVRRVDDRGRAEASATNWRVANVAGEAGLAPLQPAWPDEHDWPAWIENGRVHLRVAWDRPLKHCRLKTVELRGEIDGGAETTLATPTLDMNRVAIALDRALPVNQARYRWRITSPDGASLVTPWSALVRPADHAMPELQPIESVP